MGMIGRIALLLLLLVGAPARAEINAALSADYIDVTTGFSGADLVVFGTTTTPLTIADDILVVVRGAPRLIVVQEKQRIAGVIWANAASARFPGAPGFYAVAGTRPPSEALPATIRRAESIGLEALTFPEEAMVDADFRAALLAMQAVAGLWFEPLVAVTIEPGERLFHVRVPLPAAIPPGAYRVEILEIRERRIVARKALAFRVERVGLADQVTRLARQQPLIYGLGCIVAAAFAGWAGSVVFRRG